MRLLFVALTSMSTGEVGVGLDIANQVADIGIDSHFIVEPAGVPAVSADGYPHTVVDESMGESIPDVMRDAVREFAPDVIVLSDYFSYCAEMEFHLRLEPWFIEDLGIPILPIDIYEWERTDFRAELFSGSVLHISRHILDLPVQLRPVPSAHPDTAEIGNGVPYRSCRQGDRVTEATRREVRASLGLRSDRERMLLIPVSQWQHPLAEILGSPQQRLTEKLPELIVSHLRRLPEETHFVILGPPLHGFQNLPADRSHLLPPCPPDRFSQLIGSTDTMLSLHLPSQTLARTIFADVPGVAMRNTMTVAPGDLDAARLDGLAPTVRTWLTELDGPVEPFDSWPWRFTSIATPLLTDNPLTDTILRPEVLDETSFVGQLTAALYDDDTRERLAAARAAYTDIVGKIPTVDAVLPEIVQRLGLPT
ncbi:MAG TPA: DUF6365 family protein [Pseudonocardiaceae bacterium]|nr:DUF6365 family protein [Pseudonocardiaceae bacterium]